MFAIIGLTSGEILSWRGRMILHDNRREMEYLFPGQRIERIRGNTLEECAYHYGRRAMMLRDHPDMAAVEWPLDPRRFIS